METITQKQFDSLVLKIYQTLVSSPEVGLGEMGECSDTAESIAYDWISENKIEIV